MSSTLPSDAAPAACTPNPFATLVERQRSFFFTGATHPLAWRLDQLTRMERLLQEVFDPVSPVLPYDDFGAMVETIVRKPKSLAAYIFSKNQAHIDLFLGRVSFGGGCVNQTNLHCWIDSLPFGGVGYSGIGKYYGKAGFDALSNTKAMLIGNPDAVLDVFPPYAGKDIAKNLSVFSG